MDELKRKLIANLQGYLRERQDFIASIPTMDPIWTAPFDIIENIIEPILGSIKIKQNCTEVSKCPNLFLLFDNIVRSEDIRAGAIEFHVKIISKGGKVYKYISKFEINDSVTYSFKKIPSPAKKSEAMESNYKAAIYLGTSGCQAFYSIIENILRNTTRHSSRQEIQKVVNYSKKIIDKQKPDNSLKPLIITIEFHIDDKENSHKEDYILVRIYDNMGGWTKNNDGIWVMKEKKENGEEDLKSAVLKENVNEKKARVRLLKYIKIDENLSVEEKKAKIEKELNSKIFNRKFNPQCEEGRIIDETGKIIEGGWGLKEMRICASFLRGFKIENYEQPLPENEPPVITPYIQTTKKKKKKRNTHSLGYTFYLPKVKDLLIISKEMAEQFKDKIPTLKTQGIYIESDINKITELQSKGKFTHEFVVIDVDEVNNVKFIEDHYLELPYKLFYLRSKDENCPEDILRLDSRGNKRIINMCKLKEWFNSNKEFTIKKEKVSIKSYERVILEIKKKWIEYLLNDKEEALPKILFYFVQTAEEIGAYKPWCDTLTQGISKIEELKINESKSLVVFDHKFNNLENFISKEPVFLVPFTHGISNPNTKIKEEIEKVRGKDGSYNYSLLCLYFDALEMALTNIVVIDERIFNEFANQKDIFVQILLAFYWYLQNVCVFNLTEESGKFKLSGYKKNNSSEKLKKEDFYLNDKCLNSFLPKSFENKVHFLIIHQTIIDTRIGKKEGFQKFLNSLIKYKPWHLIVTSGRGQPPAKDIPTLAKFCDFSNIRKPLIDLNNKYILTKFISSLKRGV